MDVNELNEEQKDAVKQMLNTSEIDVKYLMKSLIGHVEKDCLKKEPFKVKTYKYDAYKKICLKYLKELEKEIAKNENIFDLEDIDEFASYSIEIRDGGFNLYYDILCDVELDAEDMVIDSSSCDGETVVEFPSKLVTVKSFSKLYDVKEDTVMRWIKQCKIKGAAYDGNSWKIPELSIINDNRKSVTYVIKNKIENLPKEYGFLEDCYSVSIESNEKNKLSYTIVCNKSNGHSNKKMSEEDAKKFELYLISNSDIEYSSLYLYGLC